MLNISLNSPVAVGINQEFTLGIVYESTSAVDFDIDFGDGHISTDHNYKHSYIDEGEYLITVTGENKDHDVITVTKSIRVLYDIKQFPLEVSSFETGLEFATIVNENPISGHESRIRQRQYARSNFNAALAVMNADDANMLRDFYLNCRGKYGSFLLKDYMDYRLDKDTTEIEIDEDTFTIQIEKKFKEFLGQRYTKIVRNIKHNSFSVYVNDSLVSPLDYSINYAAGRITFDEELSVGDTVYFEGEYLKRVRFDTDTYSHQTLLWWIANVLPNINPQDRAILQPINLPMIELIESGITFEIPMFSLTVLGATSIRIDIEPNENVSGYEVEILGSSITDIGNLEEWILDSLTPDSEYQIRLRSYDNFGQKSEWSNYQTVTTDGFKLSAVPLVATLPQGAEITFTTDTPISGAVWTLEGDGTLDQSGNYTAPNHGGTARIRYHSPMWEVIPEWFTKQDDDRLVVNDDGTHWWHQAIPFARMTAAGDYVEFIAPVSSGLLYVSAMERPSTAEDRWIIQGTQINEYYFDPTPTHHVPAYSAGDKLKMRFNESNKMEFYINDSLEATSDNDFSPPFRWTISLPMPLDTVVELPTFGGSGITGYTEYYAEVTIS